MTVKTREEYAALHKQAEERAIIIAEQQRKGEYVIEVKEPKKTSVLERFLQGLALGLRRF